MASKKDTTHPYIRPQDLGTATNPYKVVIITDGSRTLAELWDARDIDEETGAGRYGADPIGIGSAVRSSGDKRNPRLGVALATARALRSAADGFDKLADDIMHGRPTPQLRRRR